MALDIFHELTLAETLPMFFKTYSLASLLQKAISHQESHQNASGAVLDALQWQFNRGVWTALSRHTVQEDMTFWAIRVNETGQFDVSESDLIEQKLMFTDLASAKRFCEAAESSLRSES